MTFTGALARAPHGTRAGATASGAGRRAAWLAVPLAAWLGALLFFSAVVAPAAFAVLPSRALAGALVGRALPVLFWAGALLGGVLIAAPSLGGAARAHRPWYLAAGGLMAATCLGAQLVVGARIARVRAAAGPSLDALAPDHPLRAEFGRLHGLSVVLLAIAALAAAAALAISLRRAGADDRG